MFDTRGPAARWSEGSRRSIASGYGRWIGYLENMEPECLELAPSVRVTEERIRAYVSELEGSIIPSGLFNYVKHLYDAIRVMAPTADWSWLRELAKRLGQRIVRRPKRERMRDGDQLLDLGIGLMESAEENPSLPLMLRTVQYRDGLIIAILASHAPRRRNLAMMRIGRHVQKIGDIFYLVFEGDETKNGQPLESPLPKLLTSYIDHYLAAIPTSS